MSYKQRLETVKKEEIAKLLDTFRKLDTAMRGKFFEPVIEHALLIYKQSLFRQIQNLYDTEIPSKGKK